MFNPRIFANTEELNRIAQNSNRITSYNVCYTKLLREKVALLQEVDHIFIKGLKDNGLYDQVWQAGVMLLPIQSVGVMGDERTYERVVASYNFV